MERFKPGQDSSPLDDPCRCGAANCRGTMLAPIDAGQSGDRTLGRGWGRLTHSLWSGFNPIREEAGIGSNWSAHHQDPVEIRSRDFWVKVVEMLQQNWALIDEDADAKGYTVYFIDDLGRVFDRMRFGDLAQSQE